MPQQFSRDGASLSVRLSSGPELFAYREWEIATGREITHQDLGIEKLKKFFKLLEDIALMEQAPTRQGYQMTMMLTPLK